MSFQETLSAQHRASNAAFARIEQAALRCEWTVAAGPASVMRTEHAQVREFFADLRQAVEQHDADLLADAAETLLFLLQQHNAKEENVPYPTADRLLSDDRLARFADLQVSG